jgi:hypothetical protein
VLRNIRIIWFIVIHAPQVRSYMYRTQTTQSGRVPCFEVSLLCTIQFKILDYDQQSKRVHEFYPKNSTYDYMLLCKSPLCLNLGSIVILATY